MKLLEKITTFIDKNFGWTMAVAVGVPAIAIIVILVIVFGSAGKDDTAVMNQSGSDSVLVSDASSAVDSAISSENINVSSVSNDAVDPEITLDNSNVGTKVEASQINKESGKSHGIDVSKWQGKIDWAKVKNSGIEFAFIRIGYRGENGKIYKDENADYNIQQAEKNGVLVGVYFFSTAVNTTEAVEEANWTLNAIKGYSISYPVVYDCEGFLKSTSRMYRVSADDRGNNAAAFLKTVASAGYDAMLYGAVYELSDPNCWDLTKIGSNYKIWVAQYPEVTYPSVDKPKYSGRYNAWQYTNKGVVNGVSGYVDMVVAYFTKSKANPKDNTVKYDNASAPLTDEEKIYKTVNEQVTAKDTTNLRESATTNSEIVATLKNGEAVTRVAIGSNGWSKLEYNGKIVYAVTSLLTTDMTVSSSKPSQSSSSDTGVMSFKPVDEQVTAKDTTNLRSAPTTQGSEIIHTLKNGEIVKRVGINTDKGWSKLEYNGQTVYAVNSYLTTDTTAKPSTETTVTSSSSSASNTITFKPVDEQVTAKDTTNLRSAPTTQGSEIIHTLKNGEFVKRVGINTDKGWSKLEYNGQTVYAVNSYLTTEKASSSENETLTTSSAESEEQPSLPE